MTASRTSAVLSIMPPGAPATGAAELADVSDVQRWRVGGYLARDNTMRAAGLGNWTPR
jgi:hypothetical protein